MPVTAQEAAIKLLDALAARLGSEIAARKLIVEASPDIAQLLPRRKRGRPATALQREKDAVIYLYYDMEAQRGKFVRGIARGLHKLGVGGSVASIERKLYSLRVKRRGSTKENP